jgi:hypothetical protein
MPAAPATHHEPEGCFTWTSSLRQDLIERQIFETWQYINGISIHQSAVLFFLVDRTFFFLGWFVSVGSCSARLLILARRSFYVFSIGGLFSSRNILRKL